jgi:hypothetical protein
VLLGVQPVGQSLAGPGRVVRHHRALSIHRHSVSLPEGRLRIKRGALPNRVQA